MSKPTSYPELVSAAVCPWFLNKSFRFEVLVFSGEPRQLMGHHDWDFVLVNSSDLERLNSLVVAEFGAPIDIPEPEDDLWVEAFAEDWLNVELGWIEILD